MSLSVCLITKDEETNIARALRSVKKVADEIVVADTGSTDNTLRIAGDFGAKIFNFVWIDDFSAARHFPLRTGTKGSILWLDADEELLPESRDELRRCLERKDAFGFIVLRRDLYTADRPDSATEMKLLRLFRRHEDVRFAGRYHEHFDPPLEAIAKLENKYLYESAIKLRHYGYIGELKKSKLERSAKFLKLELTDRPGQLYYEIEYGRTLLLLGDENGHTVLREATKQMLEKQAADASPLPLAAALIEYLLVTPPESSQCPLNATQLHELAERWFPDAAPLLWVRAQKQFQAQDFDAASRLLEKLVRLGRKGTYDKSTSFEPRIIGDDAALNLAVCYIRLGRLTEAEPLLRRLLGSP